MTNKIRKQAHKISLEDLKKRIIFNPKPTKEELYLGCYLEMLEPQVREAVREFNKKGYPTWSSGFYGEKQAIDGFFVIDKQIKIKLKKNGVNVVEEKNGYSTVEFIPNAQNLKTMKKQWHQIAKILPTKKIKPPSDSAGSKLFRKNPLKEAFYEIGQLEYLINRN